MGNLETEEEGEEFIRKSNLDVKKQDFLKLKLQAEQATAELTAKALQELAVKEATRDGAIAIDIVDGKKLAEKLKELSLGVKIELVERVEIDEEWFKSI